MRTQADKVSGGFFIRRFDKDQDELFQPIVKAVETELGISIRAVWEVHHNDVITDRILRLIREAEVVVVDLTGLRFNVGIELGYAMALGKPIVLLKQREVATDENPDPDKLPFDVSTMNCYIYDLENTGELLTVVLERVRAGLRTARADRPRYA